MNNSLFEQVKHPGTLRIGIILLGFVLCVLLFFLEYTYSIKHGDLVGSIIYALAFPIVLTTGLLNLTLSNKEIHIPWHKRLNILMGLMLLLLAVFCLLLLINSRLNNNLPDAVFLPIDGVSFLLILLVFLRLVVVRRSGIDTK